MNPQPSQKNLPALCEWDGMRFVRKNAETWISKCWAIKGPVGLMMDKELPEKYCSKLEEAYQYAVKNPDDFYSKLKIIGLIRGDKLINKRPPAPSTKSAKPAKPRKAKASKGSNKALKKTTMINPINPFAGA